MIPPFSTTASAPSRTKSASSIASEIAESNISLTGIPFFTRISQRLYPSHFGLDSVTITEKIIPGLFAFSIKMSFTREENPKTRIVSPFLKSCFVYPMIFFFAYYVFFRNSFETVVKICLIWCRSAWELKRERLARCCMNIAEMALKVRVERPIPSFFFIISMQNSTDLLISFISP